jgi:ribosomal protein S18 acetylase RimI-like enzyme
MEKTPFDPHIRTINIRKDLTAVADLIDLAFADHMDDEGRDYLRHIRMISRSLGGYLVDGTTPETSQFPFHGYLWEEDHRIIGNLTLIPVRKREPGSYFIANVAVHPDFRGRGIARQLTDRAIVHVRQHLGKMVYLQVREDNPPAIHIYQQTGFEEFSRRTSWVVDGSRLTGRPNTSITVTRRKKSDWQQQLHWLRDIYPETISWNLPYSLDRLQPGFINQVNNFLNGFVVRSLSAYQQSRLIGIATFERGFAVNDYIWLASSPVWEDSAISTLIPRLIARSFKPRRILVNYPANRGVEAFTSCGMRPLHTLIWMKLAISLNL